MGHPVTITRKETVAVVAMMNPERRNAMDTRMVGELLEALRSIHEATEFKAMIITGSDGVFSSGADVGESLDHQGSEERMRLFRDLYELLSGFSKPAVAAIDGPCIGGGAEVAAACDLRVGTAGVRLRFPGAHFGIPVGAARLPLLVGLSHAKDLIMTSRTIDGDEAFRVGFLNRLVEPGALEQEALQLAESLGQNAGAAVLKALLNESAELRARVDRENRYLARWQPR